MSQNTDPTFLQDDEDALEGPDVEVPTGGNNPPDNTTSAHMPETTEQDGTPVENPSG